MPLFFTLFKFADENRALVCDSQKQSLLRSFAVVPSDGPLLNRADFNKVFGPVLISLFQSQDQRQKLFHKFLSIHVCAKLAIIGIAL